MVPDGEFWKGCVPPCSCCAEGPAPPGDSWERNPWFPQARAAGVREGLGWQVVDGNLGPGSRSPPRISCTVRDRVAHEAPRVHLPALPGRLATAALNLVIGLLYLGTPWSVEAQTVPEVPSDFPNRPTEGDKTMPPCRRGNLHGSPSQDTAEPSLEAGPFQLSPLPCHQPHGRLTNRGVTRRRLS